jgi:hypothetical protein
MAARALAAEGFHAQLPAEANDTEIHLKKIEELPDPEQAGPGNVPIG